MFEQMYNTIAQPVMHFLDSMTISNVFEILIIAFLIYKIYRYITGTQAEQLLKGILMLLLALLLSKIFRLQIIGRVLESIVNIVLFSLVVIFQPELRRILGYLGQPGILNKNVFAFETESEVQDTIGNITEAVKHLSKTHTGALIVIYNTTGFENYMEVGIKLDAKVSTELLLTIFHPNTPLHDGAVVINGDKVIAAGVLLPLTEDPKLSWQYGTRHRAAIGMSEVSDAACIVVSEETGTISIAQGGVLTKYEKIEELKAELEFLYGFTEIQGSQPAERRKFRFGNIFSKEFSRYPNFLSRRKEGKQ